MHPHVSRKMLISILEKIAEDIEAIVRTETPIYLAYGLLFESILHHPLISDDTVNRLASRIIPHEVSIKRQYSSDYKFLRCIAKDPQASSDTLRMVHGAAPDDSYINLILSENPRTPADITGNIQAARKKTSLK